GAAPGLLRSQLPVIGGGHGRRARARWRYRFPGDTPPCDVLPGNRPAVTEVDWIGAALTAARPQAVAALLRYFRDLDVAEEAFQEASLRALKVWPVKGPPRDPAAWLIFVGRNSALDDKRRRNKEQALPSEETLSDDDDAQASLADQ